MLLQHHQVAIVGGGPGGLTLARLLQRQGLAVTVYERDAGPHVRPQGSSLDLHHDTGLKALAAAGLLEEFKQHYRPGADQMRVTDGQLNILLDEQAKPTDADFGSAYFRPEIDRGPLRDLLVASLQPATIVWDARFTGMQPVGSGWTLHFENGTHAYADLVVAADGANSKVRRYLTTAPPVYAGVLGLEGNIPAAEHQAPALWQLVRGGSLMALENSQAISLITKGDGTLTYWLWLQKPADWLATTGPNLLDRAAVAAWFGREFSTWSAGWQELFASDQLTLAPRPAYYYPLSPPWPSQPNLTLLGDAAHRMPPNGEGVNQAMADALDLYEVLCREQFPTLGQAIAAFEQRMAHRIAPVAADTQELLDMMRAPNGQQLFLAMLTGGAGGQSLPAR